MVVSHDNNTAQAVDNRWLAGAIAGFAICSLVLALFLMTKHPKLYLTLEMSSSTPSKAQLYYNTGSGYNEAESHTVIVTSDSLGSFQKLRFELPSSKILGLRFDPLTTAGRFAIRDITISNRVQTFLKIPPTDVVAFNQIQNRTQQQQSVIFSTTSGAIDAGVVLLLHRPFNGGQIIGQEKSGLFLIGSMLFVGIAVAVYRKRSSLEQIAAILSIRIKHVDARFRKVAQKLSTEEFIQFDSYAIWFYVLCLSGFALASIADLNGSSIGMYNAAGEGAPKSVLIGAPRAVRSDEWVYYTPDIMNECLRLHRFEVEKTARGGHNVSLMDNIPVWHISTLFRPQFWAFFVLPVDYAFAVYWQFKGLLLLLGFFTWLLLITRSSFWSITGSLWLYFSPFTQWCYSWSSELPEMMGLSCLLMVLFCFLTTGKNSIALAIASWAAATCAVDLALCAYVPHLLPLGWLCVVFSVSWCIAYRAEIFKRDYAWSRILAIGIALVVICSIGTVVYLELRQAIAGMENTTYPGKRVFAGGSLPLFFLTSHFMQWTDTESHFPSALSNICEGSGYLWLAPVTLFFLGRVTLTRFQKIVLGALWLFAACILAWILLPVPSGIAKLFGMTRVGGARCIPALGLVNVAIVALVMTRSSDRFLQGTLKTLSKSSLFGKALGAFVVLVLVLALTNEVIGSYYSGYTVAMSAAVVACIVLLMIKNRQRLLAVALVVPQVLVFGDVNPVNHGLDVVLRSSLYQYIHHHHELLRGEWMVFSDSVVPSGFLAATGSQVYTGMRFLPDIDHLSLFASRGLDVQTFNNGTYLVAHPLKSGESSSFQRVQTDIVKWNVSPSDPLLTRLGIKYLAFDHQPSTSERSYLIPLAQGPMDGLWLYKLP